jgi:hypothetical protein
MAVLFFAAFGRVFLEFCQIFWKGGAGKNGSTVAVSYSESGPGSFQIENLHLFHQKNYGPLIVACFCCPFLGVFLYKVVKKIKIKKREENKKQFAFT